MQYDLLEKDSRLVKIVADRSLSNRIKFLFNRKIVRNSFLDILLFKLYWLL